MADNPSVEFNNGQPSYIAFKDVNKDMQASGLDLAPTINWYQANSALLSRKLDNRLTSSEPTEMPLQTEGLDHLALSEEELKRLYGLFPSKARNRSIAGELIGEGSLWFHKDSTPESPKPTTNPDDRLSNTAIIPGYTDYSKWPKAGIHLYELPSDIFENKQDIAKLITAETFVHEYFHTLTTNLVYGSNYVKLPDGRLVEGFDYILQVFGTLAEGHDPISHYSSFYRNQDRTFKSLAEDGNVLKTAVAEELCESGASYLLGFASGSLGDISETPLADRTEIELFIQDFLEVEVMPESALSAEEIKNKVNPEDLTNEYKVKAARTSTPAGQFSDGSPGLTEEEIEVMNEEAREVIHQKEEFIQELEHSGKINATYANVLLSIRSYTGSGRNSEFQKVKVAVASNERKLPVSYSVNVGGGLDWQWPVASGVRELDLVDFELSTPHLRQQLIESIKEFDEAANVEENRVTFSLDFGNGPEKITVNILPIMVQDYSAAKPLDGVFESHGPTKDITDRTKTPVSPDIAKQLHDGAIICNFDYYSTSEHSPSGLMNLAEISGKKIFEVADVDALKKVSQEAIVKKK